MDCRQRAPHILLCSTIQTNVYVAAAALQWQTVRACSSTSWNDSKQRRPKTQARSVQGAHAAQ
jgi:hypothetical protein